MDLATADGFGMTNTPTRIDRKADACDEWDGLNEEETKEVILEVMADFHIRNGVKNIDGSLGEIKITPKQLRDALAYMSQFLPGTEN